MPAIACMISVQHRSGIMIAMAVHLRRALHATQFGQFPLIGRNKQVLSMVSHKLASIPEVEIDPAGTFKYVLINIYGPKKSSKPEDMKTIVRGFEWAAYHADIYDKVQEEVRSMGLRADCVGGGRIKHEPGRKKILVYGYSQGFGKADHSVSVALLKNMYSDYDITWSDEGY